MPHTPEDSLAIVVSEHWLDQFCEHVGSLCAVLQALSRIPGHDRPHTLASEALENCASLQDLLNAIPVWGGAAATATPVSGWLSRQTQRQTIGKTVPHGNASDVAVTSDLGDSFPEFVSASDDQLPAINEQALEEICRHDPEEMRNVLQRFCQRSEGDLRQLEMLSVGHDWIRLSRLAGVLKDSAARVWASRIVVDAAALQGAARIGCRNDVDLALGALRSDLRDCVKQAEAYWQTETPRCSIPSVARTR